MQHELPGQQDIDGTTSMEASGEESEINPVSEPVSECLEMCRLISQLRDLFREDAPYMNQITQIEANYSRLSTSSPLVMAFAGVSAQAETVENRVHLARTYHYGQFADDEATEPSFADDANEPYSSNPLFDEEAKESSSHDDDEDEQNSTTRGTKRPRRGSSVNGLLREHSVGTFSNSSDQATFQDQLQDWLGELDASQYNQFPYIRWNCDWNIQCDPGMHLYRCQHPGCVESVHHECTALWANENGVADAVGNYCKKHDSRYQDWMAQKKLPARPN